MPMPTVARMVWFFPEGSNTRVPVPAIVKDVHRHSDKITVDITSFHLIQTKCFQKVLFVEVHDPLGPDANVPYCTWPDRVGV